MGDGPGGAPVQGDRYSFHSAQQLILRSDEVMNVARGHLCPFDCLENESNLLIDTEVFWGWDKAKRFKHSKDFSLKNWPLALIKAVIHLRTTVLVPQTSSLHSNIFCLQRFSDLRPSKCSFSSLFLLLELFCATNPSIDGTSGARSHSSVLVSLQVPCTEF